MYLNKAFVIGNLTRDPEMRSLASGVPVASFSIATNRAWNDKEGNKQEDTQFHNIVVFGRQAETSAQYLSKGSLALVEGRLQTRNWEQDGVKKYRTEIVADRVTFGPRGAGGGGGGSSSSSNETGEKDSIDYPDEEIDPEDIPF